jgi:CRP/FNR family transcriptional regulator, cyclic AMP receptor protein
MTFPIEEQSWIDALPEPVKCEVLAAMTPMHLNKGENIYTQGSASLALYRVERGQVAVCNISTHGKEFIVGLIETGSCFGELGIIDGLPRANNAYAQGEVQLQVLSKSAFWRLRQRHPEIADQLLLFINHRLRLSYTELENFSLSTLPQQLARRLCYIANRYSTQTAEGWEFTLRLTQEDLGKTLGVSRQSIYKTVKILLKDNLIRMKNGHFLVPDLDQLKAFADQ